MNLRWLSSDRRSPSSVLVIPALLLLVCPMAARAAHQDDGAPLAALRSSSNPSRPRSRALLDFDNICSEAPANSTQLIDCTCGFDFFPPKIEGACETGFDVCVLPVAVQLVCGRPAISVGLNFLRLLQLALPLSFSVCYNDLSIAGTDVSFPLCLSPLDLLSGASILSILLGIFNLGFLGPIVGAEQAAPPPALMDEVGDTCRAAKAKLGDESCASAWLCTDPNTGEPCVSLDCTNANVPNSDKIKVSTCSPIGFFPEKNGDQSKVEEIKMLAFDEP